MAGVRTPIRQFASCVLVDIDDTDSIFSSDIIGKNMSHNVLVSVLTQVESGASTVKSGVEKFNTQVWPLSKNLSQLLVLYAKRYQRRIATVHFPIWHQEIQDILVLKTTKEQKTTESENSTTASS